MPISAPLTKTVQGCLTILLLASPTRADTFGVVKVDSHSMIMINIDTIAATPEGYRRAWIATARSGRPPDHIYSSHDYAEYDCSGHRYRILFTITYGRNDFLLKIAEHKDGWRRESQETNAHVEYYIVCRTLGVGNSLISGNESTLIKSYRRMAGKK